MFFDTNSFVLMLKFLWLGLVLGVFKMFCNVVCKISHRNIFIVNIIDFCFWSIFSLFFVYFCIIFYDFNFCWFGFVSMLLGIYFVKFTIEFCFTKITRLLYNKIVKMKSRKSHNGKLQNDAKI